MGFGALGLGFMDLGRRDSGFRVKDSGFSV